MREIKFRAWTEIPTKEWLPDVKNFKREHRLLPVHSIHFGTGKIMVTSEFGVISRIFPEEAKIEQYTGLKDKNGREIYEGDIVYEKAIGGDDKGQVVFMDGSFDLLSEDGAIGLGPQIVYGKYEVIGNIHENPGLIE